MNQIFLSYRREDSADVSGRIYDRLAQHFGQNAIFTDVNSIPLGIDFQQYIDEQVGKCDIFLAVIGRDWLSVTDTDGRPRLQQPMDFVRVEIESALQRNIPVIPLLVRRATMPSGDDLPDTLNELATRNGMPIRPNPDFHRDMERLINGIEQGLSRKSEAATKRKVEEQNAKEREKRQNLEAEASHNKTTQNPSDSATPASTTTATDVPNNERGNRVFDWVRQHLYGVCFVLFLGAVAAWSAYKIPMLNQIENTVEKSSQEFLRLLGEQDAGAISDMVEIPFFYGDDKITNPDKLQVQVFFTKLFQHARAGTGQESDNIQIRLGAALSGYLSREMKRKDFDVFKTISIKDIEPDLHGEKEKDRGDIPEPRISIGDDGARASVRVSGYKPLDVMYLFFSVRGDASGLRGILLHAKD